MAHLAAARAVAEAIEPAGNHMNIEYSGQNWEMESPVLVSIEVIEPPESECKKKNKKGKKKKTKIPFGFSRALVETKGGAKKKS